MSPRLDAWLGELGLEVVDGSGEEGEAAFSRDLVLDGERRFDLRVTVAWVDDLGLSVWAYYGAEAMEIPKRTFHRMLRASFDHPFVKFALTDDDRPMLMTELPPSSVSRDELGRSLARLIIVSDRLLEETAQAAADHGQLPDWSGRQGRNPSLLAAYRKDVEATLPEWSPPAPSPPRRGLLARLLGPGR